MGQLNDLLQQPGHQLQEKEPVSDRQRTSGKMCWEEVPGTATAETESKSFKNREKSCLICKST